MSRNNYPTRKATIESPQPTIAELVVLAKDETDTSKLEINMGVIPNFLAQDINLKTQIRVNEAKKTLSKEAIVHTFKGHGNDQEEGKRGQKGIIDKDFELIPVILNTPDEVKYGGKNSWREDSLLFIKKVNTISYYVVMAVKFKKGITELSFSTMYAKK
jgi:hypothetical protein